MVNRLSGNFANVKKKRKKKSHEQAHTIVTKKKNNTGLLVSTNAGQQ